ncbi:MAG: [acyl-carrier-protein] S-malonyltransferase [Candidatus Omnitrophica bacterium CG_4_9_14_0_2_um_filter_42_8]|nr:MAG: [acyl-carrier-protein] S-malonyltransferase [Candidatus Omnitrophica bacterium CG22_combo_CG10-13_8_21_14_all_43_16]PJC47160.1 MAG: [acyl-carrier-protein] S-malonyltransferase [Candidatus Omnitrophica bacterium CG_4_9_14_0_2_um_filter_42_8]
MVNKICYIFPGQGSQYAGMGKDLYDNNPEAKNIFDQAEKILPGLNLKKLCFEGPIEELTQTANSQVAILVTSIAALQAIGPGPQAPGCCAGLSLGEYSALVAAGSLEFLDAVRLVRRRGELMEQAAKNNPGTMASIIGLSAEVLREVCKETKAEIANLNSPGQIVISGKIESVQNAMALAETKGAKKAILLNVSGPFHSSFMKEAAEEFRKELDKTKVSAPKIAIVSNVTADYEKTPEEIKENLVQQLYSTVRWEESVIKISREGCGTFFEIGPGKVLKGLLRRINPELAVQNIETSEDIKKLQ